MPSQRAWNNVMFAGTQRCIMLWLIPSRSGQNIFIWGEKNNSSRCWAQSLNGEVGRCFQVPRHLRASACINVWTVSLHTACAFWDSPEIPSWSNRKHRQNWHPNINVFLSDHNRLNSRVASNVGKTRKGSRSSLWMSGSWSFWGVVYPATKLRVRVFGVFPPASEASDWAFDR